MRAQSSAWLRHSPTGSAGTATAMQAQGRRARSAGLTSAVGRMMQRSRRAVRKANSLKHQLWATPPPIHVKMRPVPMQRCERKDARCVSVGSSPKTWSAKRVCSRLTITFARSLSGAAPTSSSSSSTRGSSKKSAALARRGGCGWRTPTPTGAAPPPTSAAAARSSWPCRTTPPKTPSTSATPSHVVRSADASRSRRPCVSMNATVRWRDSRL